jgi:phosphomannomutase
MVTGSHIPFDYNGIKFYGPMGEITKEDEILISNYFSDIQYVESDVHSLPAENSLAREYYVKRYLNYYQQHAMAGLRLGLYEHSSASRDVFKEILEGLGAQVIRLGRTEQFVPIDTEAVSAEDQEKSNYWVRKYGLDALISTDGDGDRPLVADETGTLWRGDILGLVCAKVLEAEAVVTPVSSNTSLELCGFFRCVHRTRIGSPYVIEGIETLQRQGIRTVVGFEANGGFLIGFDMTNGESRLESLLTRDAALPIISVLSHANRTNTPLSYLVHCLPSRHTASDRLKNTPTVYSQTLLNSLKNDSCQVNRLLYPIVGSVLKEIDTVDGLRLQFNNGEIVHLRPSGNSPELRCYAEADKPVRAKFLVNETLNVINNLLNPSENSS